VNTAADVRDETGRTRVISSGAGKLDISAAVQTPVTAEPATLSFGVLAPAALPVSLALRIANADANPVSLRLGASGPRDSPAQVRVSQPDLDLGPGEAATVTVQLTGEIPQPGSYEGYVHIEGGPVPLRVPYLYLVTDGKPDTYFYLYGSRDVNSRNDVKIEFRVTDRYGVPVPGLEVTFRVTGGNGAITVADATTDVVGKAAAIVNLGSQGGDEFTAEVKDFDRIRFRLTYVQ
jgi:hypothetical protein